MTAALTFNERSCKLVAVSSWTGDKVAPFRQHICQFAYDTVYGGEVPIVLMRSSQPIDDVTTCSVGNAR
ncbi:hypothetical protein [Paraburkholderia phytofirmans]|uniref:hypothetical protein n=1 Tax=Paraburkholderia sp. GAS348 TaxID=3035132 RepID=UPI0011DF3CA5